MATRMYMWFENDEPNTTVTRASLWDLEATNVIRQPLRKNLPTATNTNGTYVFNATESSTSVQDVLCGQFISIPMKPQNIDGQISGIWSGRQAAA
jgi:hypothetical protein